MQGMVGLCRSCTVIRYRFENDPLGTEENGLFLSGGERCETVRHESGLSTTFSRIPRTMIKGAILKPQVAGLRFEEDRGDGQGSRVKRSR